MKNIFTIATFGLALITANCQAAPDQTTQLAKLPPGAGTAAAIGREFHPPVMEPGATVFTPRPQKWVEPQPLNLPSTEQLDTITIRDKTFDIKRVSKAAQEYSTRSWQANNGKGEAGFDASKAFASYEKTDESLFFDGGGRGGRESKERLIVENCTFIIDFEIGDFSKFDPRRAAIYVNGYKEVLVRNCVFLSKARGKDPLRKVIGSLIVYDTVNVQVENCYFEGRTTGWRGHVLIYACGPTSIRNVEINGRNDTAGGIWVATGVGEGKIGAPHMDEPELMIYPPGPLLVENAWVHDQRGKENSDGIYVQSIQPYLLRNCKVENWGEDSLIDLGFRDVPKQSSSKNQLVNHGGLGMVENCEFGNGWVKDSVGMAGGMIFRNNLMKPQTFFFPYVFDGGSWYVVNNKWEDMSTVIVSGRNRGLDGWTPREGMFINGSKMFLFNNHFQAKNPLKALYVGGAPASSLGEVIVADYNIYDMPAPAKWGIGTKKVAAEGNAQKTVGVTYQTFEEWRQQTGNDKNSVLGAGSLAKFENVSTDKIKLPGGVPMDFGALGKVGLIGPVGLIGDTAEKAKTISSEFAADYRAKNFSLEAEKLTVVEKTLDFKTEARIWTSGGAYLVLKPSAKNQKISLKVEIKKPSRFYISTTTLALGPAGSYQLAVDGKPLGGPVKFAKRGNATHGALDLSAGEHVFTFTSTDGGPTTIDAIRFDDAATVDAEKDRIAGEKEKAAKAYAKRARLEALKTKFAISDLPIAGKIKGHSSKSSSRGRDYLLWQATGVGDSIPFSMDVPKAGEYEISVLTVNQADKGELTLLVDGKEVGKANLAYIMVFGRQQLTAGNHVMAFQLTAPATAKEISVRFQRLDLFPVAEKATAADGEDEPEEDENDPVEQDE